MRTQGGQLKYKVSTKWSSNLAYAIGLITSDGYLHKDARHIGFISKDLELVEKFKVALNIDNHIGKTAKNTMGTGLCYYVRFGDKNFYQFLNSIGLYSTKSKTIRKVDIIDTYFADFLRGVFDGDGTFYHFWDKRWRHSLGYQIAFPSASKTFIVWLRNSLQQMYGVKGFYHKGDGVCEIRYTKRDTRILFQKMYYDINLLYLNRKYVKIKKVLDFERSLKDFNAKLPTYRLVTTLAGLAHR